MNFGCDLTIHLYKPAAMIRVAGEDAQTFLQGQFTQDLNKEVGSASYGLWLNQKGKVVADSSILREKASSLVLSTACSASIIQERLDAYIIADDVILEDITSDWSGLSLLGRDAEKWILGKGGVLPEPGKFVSWREGFLFRGRRSADTNWEWLFPNDLRIDVDNAVAELPRMTINDMHRLRLAAGIPLIPSDLGPKDLPNEAGLELTAVSYSKGCYLGQEVMARLKAMGQVRRRLLKVRGRSPLPENVPAELFQGDKKIGELRSAATVAEGFIGLAMISLVNFDRAQPLTLVSQGGPHVHLAEELQP